MDINKEIKTLEKKIVSLMSQLKRNEITMSESKIGKHFNKLKPLDLVLYENLLKEYKKVVEEVKSHETT